MIEPTVGTDTSLITGNIRLNPLHNLDIVCENPIGEILELTYRRTEGHTMFKCVDNLYINLEHEWGYLNNILFSILEMNDIGFIVRIEGYI